MNKKIKKIAEIGTRLYLMVLLVFAAVTFFVFDNWILALAELSAFILLSIISAVNRRRKQRQLVEYIESVTYEADAAKNNTMLNFPLPIVAYTLDTGRVVWGNQNFFEICGLKEPRFDVTMSALVPNYNGKWILDGKTSCPNLVELHDRCYQVHGNIVRGQEGQAASGSMGITYWTDVTDYEEIKSEYEASRPVVMLILVDNFEELTKSMTDRARNDLRNRIEDALDRWIEGKNGFMRRYDRDRYLFVCERRSYDQLEKDKFKIVDDVHEITNSSAIHATVCVGVGYDGSGYEENFQFAAMSLDMALSRGGDQAVSRNRMIFNFYGGRGAEVETRDKVRTRVVANAMASYIRDASVVYIMGHRYADMDALGSAAGLCCLARKYGKKSRIVIDQKNSACDSLLRELKKLREYADVFITPKEAMVQANGRSLLVVVDTSRPENVEDEALLQSINRVAVIDHHRRGSSYIDNAGVTFHEQSASSACELVTEMIQELADQKDILPWEANALLAGIALDTKNFTIRTGDRTFDAAAYLRRAGADTTEVKLLLQRDYQDTVARCGILEKAKLYRDNICVTAMEQPVGRVVAAQAADEMLNISGVDCSIVLFPSEEGGVLISARSIGDINVQVLLEKLGGGGNKSAAGAQIPQADVSDVYAQLCAAIDEYLA